MNNTIDYVFSYVSCDDEKWKKSYYQYHDKMNNVRYRDNGTLKYMLRSIAQNMPFIRNVYMIVASESQVPSWVDTSRVKIVYHRDIIPQRFLPCFNSCVIEMFLHNIKSLSEKFIYANDDMFVMERCDATDFFNNERPLMKYAQITALPSMPFGKMCRIQWNYICEKSNVDMVEMRPTHTHCAMLKSYNKRIYELYKNDIHARCNNLKRNQVEFNQYMFPLFGYVEHVYDVAKYTDYVCSIAEINSTQFENRMNARPKLLCLNDNSVVKQYHIDAMNHFLQSRFDTRCKYERELKTDASTQIKHVANMTSIESPRANDVMIDFVFPFVTMNDVTWQKLYDKYKPVDAPSMLCGKERFKDNGCLKYLFRSIAQNMPWINKMHMIVMSESQIPTWINRDTVNIIYHKDFIPQHVLPVFNSSAIEMYLGRLDAVSNTFIYANDDMYALKPLRKNQFITNDGKLIKTLKKRCVMYPWDKLRLLDYNLIFDTPNNETELYSDTHSFVAYDKNHINECCGRYMHEIVDSITKFRVMDKNFNRWIFDLYELKHDMIENKKMFESRTTTISNLSKLHLEDFDAICINDDDSANSYDKLNEFLSTKFPNKCKYEL